MGGNSTGVSERCPSCGVVGEKTPRVGTFKCETGACRVHHYQQGSEKYDAAVSDSSELERIAEEIDRSMAGTTRIPKNELADWRDTLRSLNTGSDQ